MTTTTTSYSPGNLIIIVTGRAPVHAYRLKRLEIANNRCNVSFDFVSDFCRIVGNPTGLYIGQDENGHDSHVILINENLYVVRGSNFALFQPDEQTNVIRA